jgi:hypothetical protein
VILVNDVEARILFIFSFIESHSQDLIDDYPYVNHPEPTERDHL